MRSSMSPISLDARSGAVAKMRLRTPCFISDKADLRPPICFSASNFATSIGREHCSLDALTKHVTSEVTYDGEGFSVWYGNDVFRCC